MSSRFKISAATASTSNSHVLCGLTPSSIKELGISFSSHQNKVPVREFPGSRSLQEPAARNGSPRNRKVKGGKF